MEKPIEHLLRRVEELEKRVNALEEKLNELIEIFNDHQHYVTSEEETEPPLTTVDKLKTSGSR